MEPKKGDLMDACCIACGDRLHCYIPAISDDRYGCPGVFSIGRCPRCGHMMTLPGLSESDLPALYSQYYPRREVDFNSLAREARRTVAAGARLRRWFAGTDNQGHYRARPGQKVLDVGSGSCLALLELREMGVEAFGIEADPNVGVIADHFGLLVHIGSVNDDPFPGENFDLIVLNQVIEHVPEPGVMLRKLRARLKPNGRVVLSFPNTASLQASKAGLRWINWHIPYHQHHWSHESFCRLTSQIGYEVTEVRTITPNLWTLLQIRANAEVPVEGRPSPNWSNRGETSAATPIFLARVKRIVRALLARLAVALFAVRNRVRDVSGRGDSLLVELRAVDGVRS